MPNYFRDWIYNKLPKYYQITDTYKDVSGNGLLKRYLRVFGDELDENFMPYMDNFIDLIDSIKSGDKFLPLIGSLLGYPPTLNSDPNVYRKVLAYAVQIYKIKGTNRSFSLLFNLLGITTINIVEAVPLKDYTYDQDLVDYDEAWLYDSECEYCSGYNIQYSGTVLTTDQVKAVDNIINFLNPINAKFVGLIHI